MSWFEKHGRAPGTVALLEEEIIDAVKRVMDIARREGRAWTECEVDLYSDFMKDIEDIGKEIAWNLEIKGVPSIVASFVGSSNALEIIDKEIGTKLRDVLAKAGLDCTIFIPRDNLPTPTIVAWCKTREGEKVQVVFDTKYDRDSDTLEILSIEARIGWNPESIENMKPL